MNRDGLPSGRGFVVAAVRLNSLLSAPALAIVLGFSGVLLELTSQMWAGIAYGILGYLVVGSPVNYAANRRLMTPVTAWLDAESPSPTQVERAFHGILALPQRMAVSAALSWVAPTCLISLGMALAFPSGWTAWDAAVMIAGGVTAGFSVGVLLAFLIKGGVFARVREALARAGGDAARRRRLAPRVPMRSKLMIVVTGTSLVPVVFAALLALDAGHSSLDRFALSWTAQVIEELPADADAAEVAAVRQRLASRALPVAMTLAPLAELEALLSDEAVAPLRASVEAGQGRGDSRSLPARAVFAWRRLGDGSLWVAAVSASDLYAGGTASIWVLAALVLGSVIFAWLVAYYLARDISGPAAVLREAAEQLAAGDLRPPRLFESEDEMGDLARSFDRMHTSLRATIATLAESADGLEARASDLGPVCRTLAGATADQAEGTRRAASSMEEINAQVAGIASSSQALNENIEESSSSILELGASGEELNETASLLSSKVEEVSSSIEEMVRSVKQVSENTETLAAAAEETSSSMEEMAGSLREVDTSVAEAARLSERAVERAEIGRAKVRETIAGMEAIRSTTQTAEEVIRNLHGRAAEIGAIVDVIDDVADETNLLALNAAIIAAQAGEHGRAFSVVADEIKDLAERVLASTKEIGGLIRSVQEESQKATGAIAQGSASVASGVELSAEAGAALEEITDASRQSGARIAGIVSALREQAKAAGHVVDLMERVRGGVDEIRQAAAEQDRGNVVVFEGAVTMRDVAQQVRGTTEEQARGSRRIRESVEGVRAAVEQINAALQEQSQACATAVSVLEEVQGRTTAHEESTQTVERVARELAAQSEALREEVRRFRM